MLQNPSSSPPGDDPESIRAAAARWVTEALAVHDTASVVQARWQPLGGAYRAAEAEDVLHAMDRPRTDALLVLETIRAVQTALRRYADRLQEIDVWSLSEGVGSAEVHGAREDAERICAATIAALTRPPRPLPSHGAMSATAGAASTSMWSAASAEAPERGGLRAGIEEQWLGFRPPTHGDAVEHGVYGLEMLGFASSTYASWMVTVEHGIFRPRDGGGRLVSPGSLTAVQRLRAGTGRFSTASGLSGFDRLRSFEPGGNVVAKGHRGAAHAWWSRTGTLLGRGSTGVTVVGTGWSRWRSSAGQATDIRVGRTATTTAATAGGAWAGGQAGAWVGGALGTAVLPGAGTVIGATVGALLGSVAGSEAGSWVGDRVEHQGAAVGDAVGDGLGWLGHHGGELGSDVLDTVSFWEQP